MPRKPFGVIRKRQAAAIILAMRYLISFLVSLVMPTVLFAPVAPRDPLLIAQETLAVFYPIPNKASIRLKLSTDEFKPGCRPDAITIHVVDLQEDGRQVEVLKADLIVAGGRVQFLSANGPLLKFSKTSAALREQRIENTLRYLTRLNGWILLPGNFASPKPTFVQRRMRDPRSPKVFGSDVRILEFDATSGLPVLVGFPGRDKISDCEKW